MEDDAAEYYTKIWNNFARWWKSEKTLGLHQGYYEEGTNSFEEAVLNMDNYIGKQLELDSEKSENILDAGCGVGGTSIHLAQKYPNNNFIGITITPAQKNMAEKFAKERKLKNIEFKIKSYLDTGYPDNHFDKIYALESSCYASNKEKLIDEFYRILKPGGTLLIVDNFFKIQPRNPLMKKYHDFVLKGRGAPTEDTMLYNEFKNNLKKKGFKIINEKNLAKNVYKSSLRAFIIGIPFFISSMLKLIFFRRYDISKDPDFSVGISVLCAIDGAFGSGVYLSMKIKKSL